jgi:hypothetical protein
MKPAFMRILNAVCTTGLFAVNQHTPPSQIGVCEYWESKAINKNQRSKAFANYFTCYKRYKAVKGWQ